ncbi:MAG: hypothetical protein ACQGVK_01265 [Myxococcota bacterium]
MTRGLPSARVQARLGLFAGLACGVPVCVWLGTLLLAGASPAAPSPHLVRGALEALWIAQSLAIVAMIDPRPGEGSLRPALRGSLERASVLLAVPLPWLTAVAATGVVPPAAAFAGIAWGAALALVTPLLAVAADRLPGSAARPLGGPSIARAGLQLLLVVALWRGRGLWLGWLG